VKNDTDGNMISAIAELLFDFRNPTRFWMRSQGDRITFNLDEASVNGIRLGQPLESLSFLGKDESRKSFRAGELLYFTKGLSIGFSQKTHRITWFQVVQNDPFDPRFQSFSGVVIANGRELDVANLSLQRFVEDYADCYWTDRDEHETILFYEFVGLEWQVEFDLTSRLRCITTTSEPIMADETQRIAYGVTEPWPPPMRM
jgi:hypothetical protein